MVHFSQNVPQPNALLLQRPTSLLTRTTAEETLRPNTTATC